jgi:diguanylate cyclase (GGDEF)-like protein
MNSFTSRVPGKPLPGSWFWLWNWGMACVFFLFMGASAVRAEPIQLTAVAAASLGMQAQVLVEEGAALSLAEVQARYRAGQFHAGTRPVLAFGIGARPVWVRLAVENPTGMPLPFRLTLGTTWIDRLDVYVLHGGGVSALWQTGDRHANAQGLTPAAGFVFEPVFAPGRSEIYLRAETDDPLVLPMLLTSVDQGATSDRFMHYGYGFLYGFLIALAAYNAMLYAGFRKRGHLYYALYLVSFILLNMSYTGHGYAWWWPMAPGFQRYVILVLMVVSGCCGLLFASRFLALAERAPQVLRGVRLFSLGGLGLLALSLALDSQYGAALLAFSFIVLFTLCMVWLGGFAVYRRQSEGGYFLAAALCGMLGAALTALCVWGWLPYNDLTYHGAEFGILLEATLLALALAAQMRQSDVARQSAELRARIDPLTGLNNRRAFLELAAPIWNTADRNERPLSLMLLDIDHFKRINDQYGHAVGDLVLIEIANLLTRCCRAGDILSRWGGEEFVMLLPETHLEQAGIFAERARQLICAERLLVKHHALTITASFGVVTYDQSMRLEDMVNKADERLYAAKANGRNQVFCG